MSGRRERALMLYRTYLFIASVFAWVVFLGAIWDEQRGAVYLVALVALIPLSAFFWWTVRAIDGMTDEELDAFAAKHNDHHLLTRWEKL